MSRFIESICIKDGIIRNPEYHRERMNRSRFKFLGIEEEIDLDKLILSKKIPDSSKYKCRIVYGIEIESVEFILYQTKSIRSVRLIEGNNMEYTYKFLDRKSFELLTDSVTEDEILIIKNGLITDTSFSNIVFFDGKNRVTPTTYLLNGTMRQSLLKSGKIKEERITPNDLKRFISFQLINAMLDLDESPELDISMIV